MLSFVDLPAELFVLIAGHLPLRAAFSLSAVCSALNRAIGENDFFWCSVVLNRLWSADAARKYGQSSGFSANGHLVFRQLAKFFLFQLPQLTQEDRIAWHDPRVREFSMVVDTLERDRRLSRLLDDFPRHVEVLFVDNRRSGPRPALRAVLKNGQLGHLSVLNLIRWTVDETAFDLLGRACPNLAELHLRECGLGAPHCQSLARALGRRRHPLHSLTLLCLDSNPGMGTAGIAVLCTALGRRRRRGLRSLSLAACNLHDASVAAVASLASNRRRLSFVDVRNNIISNTAGAELVGALRSNHELKLMLSPQQVGATLKDLLTQTAPSRLYYVY